MKLISAILALVLAAVLPVSAQELAKVQEFLTDYEITQQIDLDSPPDFGFAGEFYFGSYTKGLAKPVYRHYDRSGQLLWSSESLDYLPEKPALSKSGNRVMLLRETHKDMDYRYFVTEVYDENGNHLFTGPSDLILRSSPNGHYFYSLWGASHDDQVALTLFDSRGKQLPVEQRFYIDASPMNESLLVCAGRNNVAILNVFTGYVTRSVPLEQEKSYVVDCSSKGNKILLNNIFEICVLDSGLNRLGRIKISDVNQTRSIILAKVLPEIDIVGFKEVRYPAGVFGIVKRLSGESIADVKIDLPPSEKLDGEESFYEWSKDALSFENGLFIYRFFSFNPPTAETYMGRSLVIRLDPDYQAVVSHEILDSRLYPMGKRDFVEIGDRQIKIWSFKEGG